MSNISKMHREEAQKNFMPEANIKQQQPLITIVTVVYNGKKEIEATIQSVKEQTYKNFEYLVIDGVSTDGTIDVIKKNESHITSWISEKDKGIYDAMNKGIQRSKGKFINFLNAGDVLIDPTTLETVAESLEKHFNIDFLYGKVRNIDEAHPDFSYEIGKPVTESSLFLSVPICHQTMFISNAAFKEVGLYATNYRIAAFYEWLIRYYTEKKNFDKILYINVPIVEYLIGGASFKNKALNESERLKIVNQYLSGRYKFLNYLRYVRESVKVVALPWAYKLNLIGGYRKLKQKLR